MRRFLPEILTLGNVAAGITAAVLFAREAHPWPLLLMILAAVLDVMDGWAARRIGGIRPAGKSLDSIADMISFGFVPAGMIVLLIPDPVLAWTLAVPYALAMGFRLWRFHGSSAERDRWFQGMPSPSAALAVVAACTLVIGRPEAWMLVSVTVWVTAAAAISRIPFPKGNHPSLKRLPRPLALLIWGGHAVCFVIWPGWATLSLMTVYLILGPTVLRQHFREQES